MDMANIHFHFICDAVAFARTIFVCCCFQVFLQSSIFAIVNIYTHLCVFVPEEISMEICCKNDATQILFHFLPNTIDNMHEFRSRNDVCYTFVCARKALHFDKNRKHYSTKGIRLNNNIVNRHWNENKIVERVCFAWPYDCLPRHRICHFFLSILHFRSFFMLLGVTLSFRYLIWKIEKASFTHG